MLIKSKLFNIFKRQEYLLCTTIMSISIHNLKSLAQFLTPEWDEWEWDLQKHTNAILLLLGGRT